MSTQASCSNRPPYDGETEAIAVPMPAITLDPAEANSLLRAAAANVRRMGALRPDPTGAYLRANAGIRLVTDVYSGAARDAARDELHGIVDRYVEHAVGWPSLAEWSNGRKWSVEDVALTLEGAAVWAAEQPEPAGDASGGDEVTAEMGGPVPFDPGTGPVPGFVAGHCGHRVAESEWRAGFRTCERCPCTEPGPTSSPEAPDMAALLRAAAADARLQPPIPDGYSAEDRIYGSIVRATAHLPAGHVEWVRTEMAAVARRWVSLACYASLAEWAADRPDRDDVANLLDTVAGWDGRSRAPGVPALGTGKAAPASVVDLPAMPPRTVGVELVTDALYAHFSGQIPGAAVLAVVERLGGRPLHAVTHTFDDDESDVAALEQIAHNWARVYRMTYLPSAGATPSPGAAMAIGARVDITILDAQVRSVGWSQSDDILTLRDGTCVDITAAQILVTTRQPGERDPVPADSPGDDDPCAVGGAV